MTFFGQLQGNPLAWIFTLISLGYFVSGLRLARTVWARRRDFTQGPLQPWKKQWAERAAFLLAVPPGVFIHELGHALAVWAFGGTLSDAGYGFYWGYVVPQGAFSAAQDWFIGLAGTLGTLLYGFALWLFLRRSDSGAWRYFGLRSLRFHLYYALLYYPLFTLFTFIGDWRIIYDFQATPLLSALTLVAHLGALGLFWWTDRRGWYEMAAFQSQEEETHLAALKKQVARNPQDERLQLQLVDALRRGGATSEAQDRLRAFLKEHPRSPQAHLIMAVMTGQGQRRISRSARSHAEQALQHGLSEPANVASARSLIAQHYLQVEKPGEALRHLDEALAAAGKAQPSLVAHLHYLRALTQRRRGAYDRAQRDITQALQLAREAGSEQALSQYRNEQETIAHHLKGRSR